MDQDDAFELSEEETLAQFSYKVFYYYLAAFSYYIRNEFPSAKHLVSEIVNARPFNSIQQRGSVTTEQLAKMLRVAWFTELQLYIFQNAPGVVPYANYWFPVQAYYAIYHVLKSYLMACGQIIPQGHTTTLRVIADEIKRRNDLFPRPWKVLCLGDPDRNTEYVGLPPGTVIETSLVLTSPGNQGFSFWDIYGLCLRYTRKVQLEKAYEDWRRSNRKQETFLQEKPGIIKNLSPTSLFHFLYRLRVHSNYEAADTFLIGSLRDSDAQAFYDAIRHICWSSMLVLEALISRYIGKKLYQEALHQFAQYDHAQFSAKTVIERWDTIKESW